MTLLLPVANQDLLRVTPLANSDSCHPFLVHMDSHSEPGQVKRADLVYEQVPEPVVPRGWLVRRPFSRCVPTPWHSPIGAHCRKAEGLSVAEQGSRVVQQNYRVGGQQARVERASRPAFANAVSCLLTKQACLLYRNTPNSELS